MVQETAGPGGRPDRGDGRAPCHILQNPKRSPLRLMCGFWGVWVEIFGLITKWKLMISTCASWIEEPESQNQAIE